jgi:hypothetical protein
VSRQAIAERLAFEQLRDHVGLVPFPTYVVDPDDVGMGEGCGRARLALQPPRFLGRAAGGRQDLDCDLAVQPGVARAVDLAHPARAEQGHDLVRAQPLPG